MKNRLGIIGGTFNPVHNGHLRLAEDVREEFALDKVLFIPTNIPPHKKSDDMSGCEDRLAMLSLCLAENDHFAYDDVEIRRGGVSYTIDTVRYLYEERSFEGKPHFIIGSDLLMELDTWKDIGELVALVEFVVLVRPDFPVEDRENPSVPNSKLHYFDNRKIDITSSEIRDRIRGNRSIRYLVPECVYRYIYEKGIYHP
jgi:nicotinate-nucleotide adenylyltransferase